MEYGSGFELNASTSNTVNNVGFWYKTDSDSNYTLHENVTSPDSGGYYISTTFDKSSDSYDLKINTTTEGISSQTISGVILDKNSPNPAESNSPTGTISTTDPTVSMSVSDDLSGVNYSYLNVSDSDGNDIDSTVGTSLDLNDLSDGDYTVDYLIVDDVGNTRDESWTFSVDTTYEGSTDVGFEFDDGYIYRMDDEDDDLQFELDLGSSEDENSEIYLKCYAGSIDEDNLFEETDSQSVGSDGATYSCEIPGDEYSGQTVDVTVEACDTAGNCQEVGQVSYSMDLRDPYVRDVQHTDGLDTFNSEFDISFDTGDSATSVEYMEYYFDDTSVGFGEGTEIEDFESGEFTVDVSGLESGEHTLYLRSRDEADRWSDPSSFEFEYYPDKSPEVSINPPENIEVQAGQTGSFSVELVNSGEFLVSSVEMSLESEVFSSQESIGEMEPGDALTFDYEVSPTEDQIGLYDLKISTDSPEASSTVSYRVLASDQQQRSIEADVDTQVARLNNLESNVSELKQKVNDKNAQLLENNISEFRQKVQEAETAVENGNYYQAQEKLDGISEDYQVASDTYETVEKRYRSAQNFKIIMAALGLLLLTGAGSMGYLVHSGKVDADELKQEINEKLGTEGSGSGSSPGSSSGSSESGSGEGLIDKIKGMFEGEPEAEEFEWDGFKDD